ncbi:MAG: 50S ribosomal protein L9 [Myxococcota bacterium]
MSQVKLILRDGVPGLGEAGDLVQVKPGFARNYLIPQGKAIFASEGRIKELEHHQRVVAEKVAKELKDLQAVKKKIESLKLEVKARVGEEGKLFGSVTTANLHELLTAEGLEVDRRRIELKDPIKEAGEFTVPVKLHRDLVADLQVHVVPEE